MVSTALLVVAAAAAYASSPHAGRWSWGRPWAAVAALNLQNPHFGRTKEEEVLVSRGVWLSFREVHKIASRTPTRW